MRKMQAIAAGLVLAGSVLATGAAKADDWCRRDARGTDCRYSSLSLCQMSARMGGGVCERNYRVQSRTVDRSYDRSHARGYEQSAPRHYSSNLSTMRASYSPEYGRITYVGTPSPCNR